MVAVSHRRSKRLFRESFTELDQIDQRWRMLKPEERVNVAIGITDLVVDVSAENEKHRMPEITEELLISRLRRRFRLKRKTSSR